MTAAELLSFMREHSLAVQASVSTSGSAQAAAVGIVVTDDFEVFFDTVVLLPVEAVVSREPGRTLAREERRAGSAIGFDVAAASTATQQRADGLGSSKAGEPVTQ